MVSFIKRRKQAKGKHARGANEANFKQELLGKDADSPTTILDADSNTSMLAQNAPEAVAGEAAAGEVALGAAGEASEAAADGAASMSTSGAHSAASEEAHEPASIEDLIQAEPPGTTVLNIADVRHLTSVEECEESLSAEEVEDNEHDTYKGEAVMIDEESQQVTEQDDEDDEDSEATTQPVEESGDALATDSEELPAPATSDDAPAASNDGDAPAAPSSENPAAASATPAANETAQNSTPSANEKPAGISLTRKKTGEVFAITREYTTVGKSKYSDVQIKNTQTVSRNHVILQKKEGAIFVEDDKSLNGTFINNERMKSGSRREVFDGDIVRLSDEELIVSIN